MPDATPLLPPAAAPPGAPRTATPLAWRLVYLVIGSVIGWSFLSTRAASAAIAKGIASMKEAIPEMLAYQAGADLALDPERNHDFAIQVDFASPEAYAVYATHPVHQKVIADDIKPVIAPGGRSASQFSVPASARL